MRFGLMDAFFNSQDAISCELKKLSGPEHVPAGQ